MSDARCVPLSQRQVIRLSMHVKWLTKRSAVAFSRSWNRDNNQTTRQPPATHRRGTAQPISTKDSEKPYLPASFAVSTAGDLRVGHLRSGFGKLSVWLPTGQPSSRDTHTLTNTQFWMCMPLKVWIWETVRLAPCRSTKLPRHTHTRTPTHKYTLNVGECVVLHHPLRPALLAACGFLGFTARSAEPSGGIHDHTSSLFLRS